MKIKKENQGKNFSFKLLLKAPENHSVALFKIAIYKSPKIAFNHPNI